MAWDFGTGERSHIIRQYANFKGKEKASTSSVKPSYVENEEKATFEDDSKDENSDLYDHVHSLDISD